MFRTKDSKSESDFNIELPRSSNVPDGVIAHIDDIVIPVSWSTVDERNKNCYAKLTCGAASQEAVFTFDSQNIEGANFAAQLAARLTWVFSSFVPLPVFICAYDGSNSILTISLTDARTPQTVKDANPIRLQIHTDATLALAPLNISIPNRINTIIRNTVQTVITEESAYKCYIDLFGTRNLYLTSSALCSYDTVSNFGMDTIIKKIPCTAGYNKMIFQSSGSTLDGLDVGKRTLRFLISNLLIPASAPSPCRETISVLALCLPKRVSI
jgi:hypothetical protein